MSCKFYVSFLYKKSFWILSNLEYCYKMCTLRIRMRYFIFYFTVKWISFLQYIFIYRSGIFVALVSISCVSQPLIFDWKCVFLTRLLGTVVIPEFNITYSYIHNFKSGHTIFSNSFVETISRLLAQFQLFWINNFYDSIL